MNNSDFNNEMNYGITMSYVKQFKKAGIITDDEYNKIDTIISIFFKSKINIA